MSPELKALLAAMHDREATVAPMRAKVVEADAVVRAHIADLKAAEQELFEMRRKAITMFAEESLPPTSDFDAWRYQP